MKICIVGGGSSGAIAASYLKKYWGNGVEITLVFDHSKPGIGVGESLTPMFYTYLDFVGITKQELIENVDSTVKLGLKFENWLNDGSSYYHGFREHGTPDDYYNIGKAYDIAHDIEYNDMFYSKEYYENARLPLLEPNGQSLHINAQVLSEYIINKFKSRLNIIDGVVDKVNIAEGTIKNLYLKDGREVTADFFVDASGFSSILFKHLDSEWVDKSSWLPINRCIPNPMEYTFDHYPPYTTAEASKDGWILQVPLRHRYGNGYLYCSEFTSDEQAFERFEVFTKQKFNTSLINTSRVLSFKSGYWKQQWVGNCISIGLSSGFAEPLEATNIHHTIYQLIEFANLYTGKVYSYDIKTYNSSMTRFYENIYLYLRFCYLTDRTDSEFWKYMTNNVPEEVQYLKEKISNDIINVHSFNGYAGDMFSVPSFTTVALGLNIINKDKYKKCLELRNLSEYGKRRSDYNLNLKANNYMYSINHKQYIDSILGKNNK